VLVTSAFIAAGMIATNTKRRPNRETEMPELQRLASIGALPILSAWDASIKQKNIGSVLLTRQELSEESDERDEALKVIHALLKHREVPVVNEDDSVSHEEISFGDNDILAATLAACMARSSLFGRVRLFLLSVTNGIYEDRHDPRSRIAVIENTDVYRHLAGESDSDLGSGGAASKIIAADIANAAGVDMWVFDPRSGSHRNQALRGQIGTYFPAHAVELSMGGTIT
jgi:glutamate 5-kinase